MEQVSPESRLTDVVRRFTNYKRSKTEDTKISLILERSNRGATLITDAIRDLRTTKDLTITVVSANIVNNPGQAGAPEITGETGVSLAH